MGLNDRFSFFFFFFKVFIISYDIRNIISLFL